MKSIAFRLFLIIIVIPNISLSEIGKDWVQIKDSHPCLNRTSFSSVAFNDKIYVFGGLDENNNVTGSSECWSSPNGINWSILTNNASWGNRFAHSSIVFGGKMWVIGGFVDQASGDIPKGFKNDVWCSDNGIDWKCMKSDSEWSPRDSHATVVFNGKIWVIGGWMDYSRASNDVWSSSDGKTWSCVSSRAPWSPRRGHSSVVFNNKIWIIGGNTGDSTGNLNKEVWSSSNGKDWNCETTNPCFPERGYFTTITLNGKMWIVDGEENDDSIYPLDCAWSSIDGKAWKKESGECNFGLYGSVVLFKNTIFVLGFNEWYSGEIRSSAGNCCLEYN